MSETVIFNITPKPIPVTAKDLGCQIATDYADKQAAIFNEWAAEVELFNPATESWAMQCRKIAEEMTDEQCRAFASVLSPLIEHLEAIPRERASVRMTDSIVDAMKEAIN